MTDAPERIWYDGVFQRARGIRHHAPESEAHPQIEYRRADLPPTLAAALAVPEIASIVKRAEAVVKHYRIVHEGYMQTTGALLLGELNAALRAASEKE